MALAALKKAAKLPLHIAALLTTAKDFSRNPVIGNHVLNRMGLHVARVCLAHGIFAFKKMLLSPLATKEQRKAFARDGFVVMENALPPEIFEKLKHDAENYNGEAYQCAQGDTLTWRAVLLDHPVMRDKKTSNLMRYCAGKYERPRFYIQQIQNGFLNNPGDPQKNLHVDCFHPTMKAWLFLEDVEADNGAFTFVPGSHRLTKQRLKWEYDRSLEAANDADSYSARGSFRVEDGTCEKLGLPQPQGLAVKANTLVVANTFGFHCRGKTREKKMTRMEVFAISRINPFNPVPWGCLEGLRDKIYLTMMRKGEKDSVTGKKRASWRKAPPHPVKDAA
ncbi:MAG: phytanoyl-CoA dioxygenase family protein [Alphaproteobacteria bacterium]|nr:phytanoyl-CoA dioxygenase family protein [Alphaproteobacteria bacterium]